MSGANGTAYVRVQVRPAGGTTYEIAWMTMMRFQSVFPESERSTLPFATQGLFSVPTGEVTVVAQIWGNHPGWSLNYATLIIEQ